MRADSFCHSSPRFNPNAKHKTPAGPVISTVTPVSIFGGQVSVTGTGLGPTGPYNIFEVDIGAVALINSAGPT